MTMVSGYNHNVRYGDSVFHVQTEDLGHKKAQVITQLFLGGNVIVSKCTAYALNGDGQDAKASIIALMQEQHKSVLNDLVHGAFDAQISKRCTNAHGLNCPEKRETPFGTQQMTQEQASTNEHAGPSIEPKDNAAAQVKPMVDVIRPYLKDLKRPSI